MGVPVRGNKMFKALEVEHSVLKEKMIMRIVVARNEAREVNKRLDHEESYMLG